MLFLFFFSNIACLQGLLYKKVFAHNCYYLTKKQKKTKRTIFFP